MNYINDKLGEHLHELSPAMQDVMQRVRQTGLHKVAAQLRGVPEFTLHTGMQELAFKLAYTHLRNQKIASGIRSLTDLEAAGVIKSANIVTEGLSKGLSKGKGAIKSLLGKGSAGAAKTPPANVARTVTNSPTAQGHMRVLNDLNRTKGRPRLPEGWKAPGVSKPPPANLGQSGGRGVSVPPSATGSSGRLPKKSVSMQQPGTVPHMRTLPSKPAPATMPGGPTSVLTPSVGSQHTRNLFPTYDKARLGTLSELKKRQASRAAPSFFAP